MVSRIFVSGLAVGMLFGFLAILILPSGGLTGLVTAPLAEQLPLNTIQLPPGYQISLYAEAPGARSLTLGPSGTLYVGTRDEGVVYAIIDVNGDKEADRVYTIDEELNVPNGVAFHDGALYVAEIDRILRYENVEERLRNPPEPEVVVDGLPDDRVHGWKFIAFGPDGALYIPVGAPCNICKRERPYASILRVELGGAPEVYASGVRNTVGFDWHPVTGDLWFTDNGRDLMGDDIPPDELNRAPRAGMHFGFPYCHGGAIPDPRFGNLGCTTYEEPVLALGPHVAALGMRFYTGRMFPEYDGAIFIAEHGSWNRAIPIGYRVMTVRVDDENNAGSYEVFAEGWLQNGTAWGRPVDVEIAPDGSLFVSDDEAGVIYRIWKE